MTFSPSARVARCLLYTTAHTTIRDNTAERVR
jgi:hypothetical protein